MVVDVFNPGLNTVSRMLSYNAASSGSSEYHSTGKMGKEYGSKLKHTRSA